MLNGQVMCTVFDISVETLQLEGVSTAENPEPHAEQTTGIIVYLKQGDTRVATIAIPLNVPAQLDVATGLAALLPDDAARRELVNRIQKSKLIIAGPESVAATAALAAKVKG